MKPLPFASFGLFLLAVGCSGGSSTDAATAASTTPASPPAAAPAGYAAVQAVLSSKCVGCHGTGRPRGGVALDTYADVMKGGEDGPIVKAGDPAGSELVAVMRGAAGHKKMPPKGPSVPEDEIKTVEAWIKDGAKPG